MLFTLGACQVPRWDRPSGFVACHAPELSPSPEDDRVEKPPQAPGSENRGQTGLPANFRQKAPEIHGSLVSPRGAQCARGQFFMKFRGLPPRKRTVFRSQGTFNVWSQRLSQIVRTGSWTPLPPDSLNCGGGIVEVGHAPIPGG